MVFQLRQATEADGAVVALIEETCMRNYAEALWGKWLGGSATFDPTGHHMVSVDGEDVGCVQLTDNGDHYVLGKLYLLPPARRQGLGAQLLEWARHQATEAKRSIRLSVLTTNPRARKFYEREGWHVVGETTERWFMEPA